MYPTWELRSALPAISSEHRAYQAKAEARWYSDWATQKSRRLCQTETGLVIKPFAPKDLLQCDTIPESEQTIESLKSSFQGKNLCRAEVGQTLQVDPVNGSPISDVAYQWYQILQAEHWVAISGAYRRQVILLLIPVCKQTLEAALYSIHSHTLVMLEFIVTSSENDVVHL